MPGLGTYNRRKSEGLCPNCGHPHIGPPVLCADCRHLFRLRAEATKRKLGTEGYKRIRRQRNLSSYGLTEDTYQRLFDKQGGCCAICGKRSTLVVDHCHTNGHVRGLLCQPCNTGLGKLGDSKGGLLRALAYLEESTPE